MLTDEDILYFAYMDSVESAARLEKEPESEPPQEREVVNE
jgi:hypothetical protein